MSLNRVELVGAVTRDPVLAFSERGTAWMELTLAVNGTRYDGEQQQVTTTFVTVSLFGWLAEQVAEEDLGKGEEVYVLGELSQRERQRKDGSKESKTRVEAKLVWPTRRRRSSPNGARGEARSESVF
jgi:single stranded DNA-binding protein